MMHYYYDRPFGPEFHTFGLLGGLLSFLLWILVLVLVFRLISRHSHGHFMGHRESPLDIAKARYAKGEITKAEFEAIKKDLA